MDTRQRIGLMIIAILVGLLLASGIATDHVAHGGQLVWWLQWLQSRYIIATIPAALLTMIATKLWGTFLP